MLFYEPAIFSFGRIICFRIHPKSVFTNFDTKMESHLLVPFELKYRMILPSGYDKKVIYSNCARKAHDEMCLLMEKLKKKTFEITTWKLSSLTSEQTNLMALYFYVFILRLIQFDATLSIRFCTSFKSNSMFCSNKCI